MMASMMTEHWIWSLRLATAQSSSGAGPLSAFIIYAMPGSLYSAKARSYLRKNGIEYVERAPGDPRYDAEVVPAIGRWIIPVLVTESGELIQDTVDILDYLDRQRGSLPSIYPETPRHRVVSHVLEMFAGEGLLRPAMHYRWNFDEANVPFLEQDFAGSLVLRGDSDARKAVFGFASDRMRKATTAFGVAPELLKPIEASYAEFLSLLCSHLDGSPYLLGGRPTVADYALMGPMYGHLARDPAPAQLMKQTAWRAWRWVERMNTAADDSSEYGDPDPTLFADDAIPDTLQALLRYIAEEYLAEIAALVSGVDQWLEENPDVAVGETVGGTPNRRFLGDVSFMWRSQPMTVSVVPYRIFMLQRIQDAFEALGEADRMVVRSDLAKVGLEEVLDLKARRRVERAENREVWGVEQVPFLIS